MNRIVSGLGTPDALWKNVTPGGILPNFGVGSSGIIKRSNIPPFNGGGGSVDDMSRTAFDKKFTGTPLAANRRGGQSERHLACAARRCDRARNG
ncbi:hypothetical protein AB7645_04620 [Bradyrhizobium sp. 956_D2_N1_5]|uniref:hypothetical protein n=1 Tax=unclassified Bradyrhizobium TaxID=2631580 RepID=UPI003F1F9E61